MLQTRIIQQLQSVWQGSALKVIVGEHTYMLGEGEAKAEVVIKKPTLLPKLLMSPSLTFGEAYMNGDIVIIGDLSVVLRGFYETNNMEPTWLQKLKKLMPVGYVSKTDGVHNAQHHYDIGNDFYKLWLDPSLTYSCAYFLSEEDSVEVAQHQKRELICRKLRLQAGQELLDIGCGWGALMFHAVEHFGVNATGITPAQEQAKHIRAEAERRGIADKVTVIVDDWRSLDTQKKYDRIVSVGMFEHVGGQQYEHFFQTWRSLLKDDGISLLHTIGHTQPTLPDPWIQKYIFPGGYLPRIEEMTENAARANLVTMDLENLQQHYASTLNRWHENFVEVKQQVTEMFDENFVRMWELYLKASEAGFRWGDLQLFQLVLVGPKAVWPLNREVNAHQIGNLDK